MTLVQEYAGRSPYASEYAHGPDRIFVAVTCQLGELPDRVVALLDTAAEWCVMGRELAQDLDLHADSDNSGLLMLTRFGSIVGHLERVPVLLLAGDGREMTVEATWFFSPNWPGPTVIGWKGCLERMRFGLDPSDESFYFAEL